MTGVQTCALPICFPVTISGVGCGLYIGVKDGKPVYTKGDPAHPVNKGTLCPKGLSEHEMVQSENRFTTPMVKKYGKLVPSSWEEAFTTT